MLEKIGKLLQGKKTYIVAILIGVGAAAQAMGYVIPEYVYILLGALGLGAVRSGIEKSGPSQ